MAYYRAMKVEEVSRWLKDECSRNEYLVEDNQLDTDALAKALVEKFDVMGYSKSQ